MTMASNRQRENIRIRRQPLVGSREALVINTARDFYGVKFSEKAGLVLVDALEPLHVAVATGSKKDVQDAIARSLDEIRDLHREALNQCRDYGYSPASQVRQKAEDAELSPRDYDEDDDDEDLELEFD